MIRSPKTLDHPTFGPCDLVPSIVAIRWVTAKTPESIRSSLSALSLNLLQDTSARRRTTKAGRDPAETVVNQSTALTWATTKRGLSEAVSKRLESDSSVEWIGPVYAAKAAEGGERSYFAINPTVLILTQDATSRIGDLSSVDDAATIETHRTALLRGYVVVRLPKANAIEVVTRLLRAGPLAGDPNAVSFENIPYLAPTCGCGCGGGHSSSRSGGACEPALQPHVPNDPLFANQWGLQRINAPNAWPITEGDPNIVVAVLDQGVELGHPDLNLWPISYSTITHTNNGGPVGNHGTACAGIISARMDNGLGLAGLASACRVMAIATNFADTEVAEGLFYAADNGARVVSMSFGVYPSWMVWNFALIEAALQYCHAKNVVLVAASGNEDLPVARFPASDVRTICVGGSNRSDVRKQVGDTSIENWWGACFGPSLDVVAPCLEIPTTDRLGAAGYTATDYNMRFNGTSSATPHVAALSGLILGLDPSLTSLEVRRVISETTDKINPAGYTYLPTAGKPFGTWHSEVGYGRINVERALLVVCAGRERRTGTGHCSADLPKPEACCVSPCDLPWRPDEQCIVWYEERLFRLPIRPPQVEIAIAAAIAVGPYIEFRVTYEHRLCLLGKQHGPLLFTATLLPGETIHLYHNDRYRRITSALQRFSVQTTFMQFLSEVHQARVTNSLDALNERLAKTSGSASSGGGFFFGLFGGGGSSTSSASVSSLSQVAIHVTAEQFHQSVQQSSWLTQAERSLVISTYEERDTQDSTVRTLHNANDCRAVTYFVRQVFDLYAVSTRVTAIDYRIIAPNVPPEWHSIDDLAWLPAAIRNQIVAFLASLPRVGQVVTNARPISVPTDGAVYAPELANCGSCEPERAAAVAIRLEKEKAEALKVCLEAQELELELERRRRLLQKGELGPFEPAPSTSTRETPISPGPSAEGKSGDEAVAQPRGTSHAGGDLSDTEKGVAAAQDR
jgi:thermitase